MILRTGRMRPHCQSPAWATPYWALKMQMMPFVRQQSTEWTYRESRGELNSGPLGHDVLLYLLLGCWLNVPFILFYMSNKTYSETKYSEKMEKLLLTYWLLLARCFDRTHLKVNVFRQQASEMYLTFREKLLAYKIKISVFHNILQYPRLQIDWEFRAAIQGHLMDSRRTSDQYVGKNTE